MNEAGSAEMKKYDLPLVSVVTPVMNQVEYIEEAICSVLEQEYPHIEYIVVDGGSTDGTLEILQNYGDKIRWLSEPDNGQSEAINKGLRMAKGQILAWLCGADDLYMPYTVRRVVEYMQEHPDVAMVHGPGQYVDPEGNVIMTRRGGDFGLDKLISVNTIMDPSVFFRREVLDQVGFFDESLHYVMGWEYWVRVAMAGLKIDYIPDRVLAQAREHSDSKTIKYKERFWQERFRVFDDIFGSPDTPNEIKQLERRAHSGVYASSAYFYLRNGHPRKALGAAWQAVRTWPGILFMYNPMLVAENLSQALRASRYLNSRSKDKE